MDWDDETVFNHDLRAAIRTFRLFYESVINHSSNHLTKEKKERLESSLAFLEKVSQLTLQIKKP